MRSLLRLTSSDLLGRGASSAILGIFCFRLSLLDGRVGLSPSASFMEDLLEFEVVPRASFELEAMVWGFGELLAACEDVMDEDEFLGRATAGGVCDGRGSMVA
jgi:hypothetical protein